MVARTEAPAAACDAAGREVPNLDEDQALADAASAGDPGTATYIAVKRNTPSGNKQADGKRSHATSFP